MRAENTAPLAAATRRRVTDTRERARTALQRLDREGSTINYVTVARVASVSRALLYRDPELRAAINRLRSPNRTTAPRQPATQRMTQTSREELLATLRAEVHTLRTENQALRARLAAVLGEQRAAARTNP
jgi:hypothetical protein